MADKMDLLDVEVWDGNMAASQAMRQAQIDVVAAYPITPSTPVVENYAGFLANGYIDGEFVMVESEHAAMSGCIGAAAAGGRVATATSSQGFALMVETLYQASGMRLPIILNVVNRALAAPLNVNGDHSDMYLGRDSGWIQFNAYNAQDAYDLNLIAFRVAEDHKVRLPAMIHQDGFMTSHTAEGVLTLSDDDAYNFIGDYKPMNAMLDFEKPATYGVQTEEDWHFEHKARQHNDLMTKVNPVIQEVFDAFEKETGRKFDFVTNHNLDDADVAIVAMGTTVDTAMMVADQLREEGKKVGVLGLRVIRPFPFEKLAAALSNVKAVCCMDRSAPGGTVGMLYNEVCGAMYNSANHPVITGYVYGLGGRDMTVEYLKGIFADGEANAAAGKPTTPLQQFIGVRGPKLNFL